MYGFKSFGAETVIEFPRAITALVGPNGGGKSNVVDALRWALGEQRPREMRAERWTDILFAGGQGMPMARLAEVILTFAEANLENPDWPDSITVTRRYYRNGESEYLINGRVVRLKDVTDLFLDSGVGRSNYAIISQGGVESALLLKPRERLEQLEESSGVSRYKLRRRETVQHLAEVEIKVTRLTDLIAEVEQDADGLKHQAQREAQLDQLNGRADELQRLIRRTRFALDQAEGDRLSQAISAALEEQEMMRSGLEVLETSWQAIEADAAECQDQLTLRRRQLDIESEEVSRSEAGLSKSEALVDAYKRELISLEARREELGQWIDLSADLDQRAERATVGAHQGETDSLAMSTQARSTLEDLQRQIATLRQAQDGHLQRLADLDQQILQWRQVKSRFEAVLGMAPTKTLVDRLKQRMLEHEREQEEILSKVKQLDHVVELRKELTRSITIQEEKLGKLEQQWAVQSAELQSLSRMSRPGGSLSAGVRAVLKAAAEGMGARLRGTLGSLIQVEPRLQDALEVALGGAHQDLVVDREEDARRWVDWLRAGKLGRATFLPLDILRPSELSPRDRDLASMPGALGFAVDLVQYAPDIEVAIRHALGRVLVVEDLEGATRLGRIHRFRFRTVTLDGQVLLVGGAITGGSVAASGSQEIRGKRGALERLQKQKDDVLQELHGGRARLQEINAKVDALREQLAEKRASWQQQEQAIQGLSYGDTLVQLSDQETVLGDERERIEVKRQETSRSLTEAESALARQAAVVADLERRYAEEQGAKDVQRALMARDLAERQRWLKEAETVSRRAAEILATLQQQQGEVLKWKEQAELRRSVKAQLLKACEQDARTLEALQSSRKELESARRIKQDRLQAIEQSVSELRRRGDMIALRWESAPLQDSERDLTPLQARELAQAEGELKRVRAEIGRIGPVERGSLGRWRDLTKRHEQLSSEAEDVKSAKAELEATLAQLDQVVAERVRETAHKVEEAFQEACHTLFGGGSASFRFTSGEEPGVDLWVAPPGKRPSRLSLLSGGEKALGGLAWLFSLLSIRHAPFVVLDEVEASLDEWNAERFGRYLNERGTNRQFIVITHHKATMEAAAALWGITGNGRGQSRVVSVLLEDRETIIQ